MNSTVPQLSHVCKQINGTLDYLPPQGVGNVANYLTLDKQDYTHQSNSNKRYIEQIYGEPSLELLRCQEGFLHCALALRELYCVYVGVALPGHIWGLPLTESSRVENWDWCGIMADSKNNVGGKMYPYMLRTPESC